MIMMVLRLLIIVRVIKKIFSVNGIWFFNSVSILSVKVMLVVVGIVYFLWVIGLV